MSWRPRGKKSLPKSVITGNVKPMTNTLHSNVPHETYVVVDVETSHTDPAEGFIFTIGACVVQYDGEIVTIDNNYYYQRINQRAKINDSDWFKTIYEPRSTLSWWLKQDFEVQHAAWRTEDQMGCPEFVAADAFYRWVSDAADPERPIFVANPATFDYSWITALFAAHYMPNPFDYRTLDLRSMAFGAKGNDWRYLNQQREHRSQVPHHAFWDAYAAALDLQDLISRRDEAAIEDKLLAKAGEFIA